LSAGSDLDPRPVEEALVARVAEAARRAGADAGLVLLRMRQRDRFLLRAAWGLGPRELARIGAHVALRTARGDGQALGVIDPVIGRTGAAGPGTIGALYGELGFDAWGIGALGLERQRGTDAGVLHLLGRGSALGASALDVGASAAGLAPLGHALRALEACRATDVRADLVTKVAQGVLQHLDMTTLFPELIWLVARLCPCDAASIAVYRPESNAFELVAVYGPPSNEAIQTSTTVPAGETPMRDAWNGEIVSIPDQRLSAYKRAREIAATGIVSSLYIPVGSPVRRGVLCVGHQLPFAFGEEEIALFRSIVPFIEVAFRNADLVGKIRDSYRELAAAQEQLVRAERLRALGEIAAGVAHDVGNVLALVSSHADLAARRATDEEQKRLLVACQRSVADGARSVRRVLDLARGSSGPEPSADANQPRVRLDELAREAILLTRPRWEADAARRGVSYEIRTTGLLPVDAPVDPGVVREQLLNLILNAIDALPRGGTLALATRLEDDAAALTVDDDGAGVPVELRERIFEPFFTSKGPGHAGLGLAVVARLSRQIGGSVKVTASALGGARFELRYPMVELGSGPHEIPARPQAAKPARGIEVLLVEDEPALRTATSELLRLRGHVVWTAGDVAGGLEALERHATIQVVVTDLGLPGRSGWELVDAVRARSATTPVIVLSGWGTLTDPASARERGVTAILGKPTTEGDLARTIEAVLDPSERVSL
jgi:signal transduction histidine kinase/CheY-like chemotaxis protein